MNGLFDNLLMTYFGSTEFEIRNLSEAFYVCFEGNSGQLSIGTIKSGYTPTFEYSTDGNTWTTGTVVSYLTGSKIYIRRKIDTWMNSDGTGRDYLDVSNGKIGGNIMSLLYGEDFNGQTEFPVGSTLNFSQVFTESLDEPYRLNDISELILPATTLTEGCYRSMFNNCYNITTPPVLTATTLADSCYYGMFANCTSLTSAPALPATTLANYCYASMFSGCTSLTIAPALPATTLVEGCYLGMFSGCTALNTVPSLPATSLFKLCYGRMFEGCTALTTVPSNYLPVITLANACYESMFSGCTSLTTAPALPANTLIERCYSSMFSGCTSLSAAPELLAPTLVEGCYLRMFYGCTNLNYIKCTTTSDVTTRFQPYNYKAVREWVYGVGSTGTFIKKSGNNSWPTGNDGIPSGWTVQEI